MRRTAYTALTALALAACGAPAESGAEATGDAAGSVAAGSSAEAAPDTAATATPGAAATARPSAGPQDIDSDSPGDTCGAGKVARFVSQEATPAVRARLTAEVGHDRIRWVGPDTAVTMDFRPDRLNVSLDEKDIITGGRCA